MNHFKKKIREIWNWWQQHVTEKLGQLHVYHCVASPLLCKRLGTEELLEFYRFLTVQQSWVFFPGHFAFQLVKGLDCSCHRLSVWFSTVLLKYVASLIKMGAAVKPGFTFQHWWSLSRCRFWTEHWRFLSSLVWWSRCLWFSKRMSNFDSLPC